MKCTPFRSKRSKGYTLFELIFVLVWVVLLVGWIHNIVNVVHGVSTISKIGDASPLLVLEIAGIPVAPLGMILGLIFW